ncbi:Uncharacterised protein [Mycobacteroides abscessus subsp. abscessus]|nr:Uncharacterised protein [Mycobacteroides abscessus subsp. abscessus]
MVTGDAFRRRARCASGTSARSSRPNSSPATVCFHSTLIPRLKSIASAMISS